MSHTTCGAAPPSLRVTTSTAASNRSFAGMRARTNATSSEPRSAGAKSCSVGAARAAASNRAPWRPPPPWAKPHRSREKSSVYMPRSSGRTAPSTASNNAGAFALASAKPHTSEARSRAPKSSRRRSAQSAIASKSRADACRSSPNATAIIARSAGEAASARRGAAAAASSSSSSGSYRAARANANASCARLVALSSRRRCRARWLMASTTGTLRGAHAHLATPNAACASSCGSAVSSAVSVWSARSSRARECSSAKICGRFSF
eukprot:5102934-Prymnesium_polylepis.2